MDVIARHHAIQNLDPRLFGYLSDDRSHSPLQLTPQHSVAVLRDPHQVIAVVVQRVTPLRVALHPRNLHAEASPVPTEANAHWKTGV